MSKTQSAPSVKSRTSSIDDTLRHLAFNNSLRASIITTAGSGKIIVVNRAACHLLGYTQKELLTKRRAAIFDIKDARFKTMMKERNNEGHTEAFVNAIKKSGKLVPCKITSAIFIGEDGIKKAITTIADMRPGILIQRNIDIKKEKIVADNIVLAQVKSDIRLRENNQWIKYIAKTSYDVMWDWDITTGEMYVGDSIEEVFGYKVQNNRMNFADFSNYIISEEKDAVEKKLLRTLKSGKKIWNDSFMFKRNDGSVASTITRANIVRDEKGKAIRMIGNLQDISRLQELERKLEYEIKLKEKQIADATEEAREIERSDIGKELHDNINQLLGASKLYLDMAKHGGKSTKMYLSHSSKYTLSAIEEIRKLTKGLTTDTIKNLGLYNAVSNTTNDIMKVNPLKISCEMESFKENSVNDKFKLNIFRIVQEKLNNIIKYSKAKEAFISLSQNNELITLVISDNGIGFDTGARQKGIGIANIKSRAATYKGIVDFVSEKGHGCVLTIRFPFSALIAK